MQTLLTDSAERAAALLRSGGVVAFPTETVYGLGADVFNEAAVRRIFEAKGRPADNPLIAHVGRLEEIERVASHVTAAAELFIEAFFPAALTLVLPRAAAVPYVATANLETIGVRMPRHALALEFLRACATPVVAPSANLSGKPSPTTWQAVFDDLNGRIDALLQGEATQIGLESTVVDCTGDVPLVLRAGAVSLEELQSVVSATRLYEVRSGEAVRSPGLKHRHYSPLARVVLVEAPGEAIAGEKSAFIGLAAVETAEFGAAKICGTLEEYAQSVYEFFRACDRRGVATIYCECVPARGLGLALMDRITRAARGSFYAASANPAQRSHHVGDVVGGHGQL